MAEQLFTPVPISTPKEEKKSKFLDTVKNIAWYIFAPYYAAKKVIEQPNLPSALFQHFWWWLKVVWEWMNELRSEKSKKQDRTWDNAKANKNTFMAPWVNMSVNPMSVQKWVDDLKKQEDSIYKFVTERDSNMARANILKDRPEYAEEYENVKSAIEKSTNDINKWAQIYKQQYEKIDNLSKQSQAQQMMNDPISSYFTTKEKRDKFLSDTILPLWYDVNGVSTITTPEEKLWQSVAKSAISESIQQFQDRKIQYDIKLWKYSKIEEWLSDPVFTNKLNKLGSTYKDVIVKNYDQIVNPDWTVNDEKVRMLLSTNDNARIVTQDIDNYIRQWEKSSRKDFWMDKSIFWDNKKDMSLANRLLVTATDIPYLYASDFIKDKFIKNKYARWEDQAEKLEWVTELKQKYRPWQSKRTDISTVTIPQISNKIIQKASWDQRFSDMVDNFLVEDPLWTVTFIPSLILWFGEWTIISKIPKLAKWIRAIETVEDLSKLRKIKWWAKWVEAAEQMLRWVMLDTIIDTNIDEPMPLVNSFFNGLWWLFAGNMLSPIDNVMKEVLSKKNPEESLNMLNKYIGGLNAEDLKDTKLLRNKLVAHFSENKNSIPTMLAKWFEDKVDSINSVDAAQGIVDTFKATTEQWTSRVWDIFENKINEIQWYIDAYKANPDETLMWKIRQWFKDIYGSYSEDTINAVLNTKMKNAVTKEAFTEIYDDILEKTWNADVALVTSTAAIFGKPKTIEWVIQMVEKASPEVWQILRTSPWLVDDIVDKTNALKSFVKEVNLVDFANQNNKVAHDIQKWYDTLDDNLNAWVSYINNISNNKSVIDAWLENFDSTLYRTVRSSDIAKAQWHAGLMMKAMVEWNSWEAITHFDELKKLMYDSMPKIVKDTTIYDDFSKMFIDYFNGDGEKQYGMYSDLINSDKWYIAEALKDTDDALDWFFDVANRIWDIESVDKMRDTLTMMDIAKDAWLKLDVIDFTNLSSRQDTLLHGLWFVGWDVYLPAWRTVVNDINRYLTSWGKYVPTIPAAWFDAEWIDLINRFFGKSWTDVDSMMTTLYEKTQTKNRNNIELLWRFWNDGKLEQDILVNGNKVTLRDVLSWIDVNLTYTNADFARISWGMVYDNGITLMKYLLEDEANYKWLMQVYADAINTYYSKDIDTWYITKFIDSTWKTSVGDAYISLFESVQKRFKDWWIPNSQIIEITHAMLYNPQEYLLGVSWLSTLTEKADVVTGELIRRHMLLFKNYEDTTAKLTNMAMKYSSEAFEWLWVNPVLRNKNTVEINKLFWDNFEKSNAKFNITDSLFDHYQYDIGWNFITKKKAWYSNLMSDKFTAEMEDVARTWLTNKRASTEEIESVLSGFNQRVNELLRYRQNGKIIDINKNIEEIVKYSKKHGFYDESLDLLLDEFKTSYEKNTNSILTEMYISRMKKLFDPVEEVKDVAKPMSSLHEEARKYKSAEEFKKAIKWKFWSELDFKWEVKIWYISPKELQKTQSFTRPSSIEYLKWMKSEWDFIPPIVIEKNKFGKWDIVDWHNRYELLQNEKEIPVVIKWEWKIWNETSLKQIREEAQAIPTKFEETIDDVIAKLDQEKELRTKLVAIEQRGKASQLERNIFDISLLDKKNLKTAMSLLKIGDEQAAKYLDLLWFTEKDIKSIGKTGKISDEQVYEAVKTLISNNQLAVAEAVQNIPAYRSQLQKIFDKQWELVKYGDFLSFDNFWNVVIKNNLALTAIEKWMVPLNILSTRSQELADAFRDRASKWNKIFDTNIFRRGKANKAISYNDYLWNARDELNTLVKKTDISVGELQDLIKAAFDSKTEVKPNVLDKHKELFGELWKIRQDYKKMRFGNLPSSLYTELGNIQRWSSLPWQMKRNIINRITGQRVLFNDKQIERINKIAGIGSTFERDIFFGWLFDKSIIRTLWSATTQIAMFNMFWPQAINKLPQQAINNITNAEWAIKWMMFDSDVLNAAEEYFSSKVRDFELFKAWTFELWRQGKWVGYFVNNAMQQLSVLNRWDAATKWYAMKSAIVNSFYDMMEIGWTKAVDDFMEKLWAMQEFTKKYQINDYDFFDKNRISQKVSDLAKQYWENINDVRAQYDDFAQFYGKEVRDIKAKVRTNLWVFYVTDNIPELSSVRFIERSRFLFALKKRAYGRFSEYGYKLVHDMRKLWTRKFLQQAISWNLPIMNQIASEIITWLKIWRATQRATGGEMTIGDTLEFLAIPATVLFMTIGDALRTWIHWWQDMADVRGAAIDAWANPEDLISWFVPIARGALDFVGWLVNTSFLFQENIYAWIKKWADTAQAIDDEWADFDGFKAYLRYNFVRPFTSKFQTDYKWFKFYTDRDGKFETNLLEYIFNAQSKARKDLNREIGKQYMALGINRWWAGGVIKNFFSNLFPKFLQDQQSSSADQQLILNSLKNYTSEMWFDTFTDEFGLTRIPWKFDEGMNNYNMIMLQKKLLWDDRATRELTEKWILKMTEPELLAKAIEYWAIDITSPSVFFNDVVRWLNWEFGASQAMKTVTELTMPEEVSSELMQRADVLRDQFESAKWKQKPEWMLDKMISASSDLWTRYILSDYMTALNASYAKKLKKDMWLTSPDYKLWTPTIKWVRDVIPEADVNYFKQMYAFENQLIKESRWFVGRNTDIGVSLTMNAIENDKNSPTKWAFTFQMQNVYEANWFRDNLQQEWILNDEAIDPVMMHRRSIINIVNKSADYDNDVKTSMFKWIVWMFNTYLKSVDEAIPEMYTNTVARMGISYAIAPFLDEIGSYDSEWLKSMVDALGTDKDGNTMLVNPLVSMVNSVTAATPADVATAFEYASGMNTHKWAGGKKLPDAKIEKAKKIWDKLLDWFNAVNMFAKKLWDNGYNITWVKAKYWISKGKVYEVDIKPLTIEVPKILQTVIKDIPWESLKTADINVAQRKTQMRGVLTSKYSPKAIKKSRSSTAKMKF